MSKQSQPSADGRKAEKALQKAVARVVEENRRLGLPIAVMQGGRAVLVSVDEAQRTVRETSAAYRVSPRKKK